MRVLILMTLFVSGCVPIDEEQEPIEEIERPAPIPDAETIIKTGLEFTVIQGEFIDEISYKFRLSNIDDEEKLEFTTIKFEDENGFLIADHISFVTIPANTRMSISEIFPIERTKTDKIQTAFISPD